jgi:hypothetical protein
MQELEEYDMLHAGDENNENLLEAPCDNPYLDNNLLNSELDINSSKDMNENETFAQSLNVTKDDKLNEAFVSEKDVKDLNESQNFNSPEKIIKKKSNFFSSEINVPTCEDNFEESEKNTVDVENKSKIITSLCYLSRNSKYSHSES